MSQVIPPDRSCFAQQNAAPVAPGRLDPLDSCPEGVMSQQSARVFEALDRLRIELPSWGFADTGTRFGKYLQPAAARTIEEKLADAGQVHALTGVCPTVALHVLWDLPNGDAEIARVKAAAAGAGVRVGAINPNVFQDQDYKFGSFGNPHAEI